MARIAFEDPADVASRVVHKGGPIRIGSTVYAHANSTHAVVGITGVAVENGNLVITHDWEEGERIIAAVAEEDETISRLGVQAGVSGGGPKSTIMLWKDGRKISPRDSMFGTDTANLWVHITTIKPAPPEPNA